VARQPCYDSSFGAGLLSDSEFNSFLGFKTARAYLEEAGRMFAVRERQFKVQAIGEDLDFFLPSTQSSILFSGWTLLRTLARN
jgi:hypothetical protein